TPEKDFEPGGGSAYVPDYTSGMNFTGDTDPLDYYAVWEKNCSIVLKKNYNSQDDSIYGTLSTEYNKALGDKLPDVGTVNAPKREGYTFAGWSTAGREATTANIDGTTVFTASETTAYAIWVRIPYTATLYQNESPEDTKVIGTIADLTWGDHLTKDQMITPERSGGYTFVGWNTAADGKGEDFVPEKSAVKGNTNLYAQWTKKPYVLNVYETPVIGEKPDNTIGPFAYGQSIKDAFPKAAAFWTNEKGVKRAFTGWVDHRGTTVTADTVYQIGDVPGDVGTLMAKYDAMAYDVTGTKIGHGSIKGQGTYAFGANPVVSWTPDKGYKVSQINVDGRIRDDLLNGGAAGSVGFMTIDKNHTVQVTFVKNNGSGDPEDPGIDDPDKAYYTVTTTKIGGDAANTLTTLTPTST
ncbi:MAG: InlB B-repeat-containing protein, partial [Eubacterium sp.]